MCGLHRPTSLAADKALSRCRIERVTNSRRFTHHATATAWRHVVIAVRKPAAQRTTPMNG